MRDRPVRGPRPGQPHPRSQGRGREAGSSPPGGVLSESAPPLLLHVGYHKTGTTWLQKTIFKAPPFALVSDRRTLERLFVTVDPYRFDATSTRSQLAPLVEDIRRRGLAPVLSHERLSGSLHGGGRDSRPIAERLVATFPEAVVFIGIREQQSMLVSAYRQYVKVGGPLSFSRYIEDRGHRIFGFDFRHFEFDRLIDHYGQLYGQEAVYVLPYELLRDDPRAYVGAIAERVGVCPPDVPSADRRNPSQSALATTVARRLNQFVLTTEHGPAPPLPLVRQRGKPVELARRVVRLAPSRVDERAERKLRAAAADAVAGRYGESNRRTAELTGLDLAALGYDVGGSRGAETDSTG